MNTVRLLFAAVVGVLMQGGLVGAYGEGLDDRVVTGAGHGAAVRDSIASVDAIPAEEVARLRYRKPEELFNVVPGVLSASFSGEDAVTAVRLPPAPANAETAILVDGLPSTPFGWGWGDFWKYFNSVDLERVEVLKGPTSSLYGSGAVGGVINVISKAPPVKPEIGAWGEYGRDDRWRGGIFGGGRLGQFAGDLNINIDNLDGWREHSRVEKQDATGNVQYFPDAESVLRLRVDFVHAHNDLPGMLDGPVFFTNPKQSNNTFAFDRIDRIAPTLTYDRDMGDGSLNLAFQVQSNTSDNTIDPADFRYMGAATAAHRYQGVMSYASSLDFNLQARYTRKLTGLGTRITGGLDYTHSDQQSDSTLLDLSYDTTRSVFTSYHNGTLVDSHDIAVNAVAPYLQVETSPLDRLHFMLGGRYDAILYDATDKMGKGSGGSRDFNRFSFRVGTTYDLLSQVNLFANYSQGFLAPTVEQLFTAPSYDTSSTGTPTFTSSANGSLSPEQVQGFEIGLRSSFWESRARFDVSYYDMTVRDKIVRDITVTNPANPLYYYQNAARTANRGVELLTSIMPVEMVRATLAYTYALNTYDAYNGFTGNLMPRAPEHHINGRLALFPVSGLQVELEVDEVTKQFADDANTMPYSRPTLVNLRANYAWQNWSFWAHLLNLTNQSYATYVTQSTITPGAASYYPGDPLTFYLGVAYRWN